MAIQPHTRRTDSRGRQARRAYGGSARRTRHYQPSSGQSKMSAKGRLAGFRVVDLTEGICGPFSSMQLADAGAEVIKVEPPKGDYSRQIGPPFVNGESAVFLSVNRNKKSVVLDYRREDQ